LGKMNALRKAKKPSSAGWGPLVSLSPEAPKALRDSSTARAFWAAMMADCFEGVWCVCVCVCVCVCGERDGYIYIFKCVNLMNKCVWGCWGFWLVRGG
jgi:hypothetical protein